MSAKPLVLPSSNEENGDDDDKDKDNDVNSRRASSKVTINLLIHVGGIFLIGVLKGGHLG